MMSKERERKKILALLVTFTLLLAPALPPFVQGQTRDTATAQGEGAGKIINSYREAAEGENNLRPKQRDGRPAWVEQALARSLAYLKQHNQAFNSHDAADVEANLQLLGAQQDDLGQTHVRLVQIHQGVEVFGGQLVAHLEAETVREVNGRVFEEARIDTTPTLDPAQAIEAAKRALSYTGEFVTPPAAKLVLLPHRIFRNDGSSGATLVYQVELRIEDGTEATAHHQYFVDASDGSIAWHYNSLPHIQGTGHSLYRGTVTISTSQSPSGFSLTDGERNNLTTTEMNNTTSTDTGEVFFSLNNVWGDGTSNNRQSAAVDVHFGAMTTWDYYLNVHGRRGIDGNSYRMTSRVHYGSNYNNAFWNGSVMTYGDGDGSRFSSLVSLDIVGHEITHGVTEKTANLIYAGESGAANESFSDIFGTAVEFYAGGNANYLLGEDCFTPGRAGDAMRSLADPTLQGHPDHYSKRLYPGTCTPSGNNDNCGVHSNSGIMNKAFYLLAEGGTHPYSRIQVPGIGRRAAEKVFYRALTIKLFPSARFSDVCQATLSAAADLFGAGSAEHQATARAWEAVGVLEANNAPCTNCKLYTGTLAGTGAKEWQPDGSYFYSASSGHLKGWLRGPADADFDLYLMKWDGARWVTVARSEGATSAEEISYFGSPGYYTWQIFSYRGSGAYSFWMQAP
jgi:thermolysin